MCELCHSVLRVLATTVCARTLTDGDGTDGRTDGRRPLGEVATFEIGGVGSILLTNTAVLWSGHTGHGPIVRQNYINQNKISIKMKPTPPVLIFEIIPMDLGDLGGRADGRTDGHGRGRTPWPSVHGATQLAHFGMLRTA